MTPRTLLIALSLVFLPASAAHAQRVPEVVLWSAGTGLFAPFFAVPVKLGILRLSAIDVGSSRLWALSALEWVLWFPIGFIALRSGRSSSVPLIVLALFASAVWLHRAQVADAALRHALLLSLATPILALVLPFLALVSVAFVESHCN